jgi:RNA polymerase primary sigma factor
LASDQPGRPVEKKNLKEVKKLIDLGKEKGYLTYDDVNDMLPAEVVSRSSMMSCPSLAADKAVDQSPVH